MPASYLKNLLESNSKIDKVDLIDKYMLRFKLNSSDKQFIVYMPSSDEYMVTFDIVTKAKGKGADLIVCEPWCNVTGEGSKIAENGGIGIYPIGVFLSKIGKGEEL